MRTNSMLIANLLMDTFKLRQARAQMYVEDNSYQEVPALYFHLKTDDTTESDYQLIQDAVDSFKGNLKWHFGKAVPSKINYEILPEVVREMDNKYPDKLFKNTVSRDQYEKICELAIADIPPLYQHMKDYFEKNKSIGKEMNTY